MNFKTINDIVFYFNFKTRRVFIQNPRLIDTYKMDYWRCFRKSCRVNKMTIISFLQSIGKVLKTFLCPIRPTYIFTVCIFSTFNSRLHYVFFFHCQFPLAVYIFNCMDAAIFNRAGSFIF